MKLTKRERKLLINPVCFGWSLYEQHSGAFYWDDDSALRFKPSLSFQACIEKRLYKRWELRVPIEEVIADELIECLGKVQPFLGKSIDIYLNN